MRRSRYRIALLYRGPQGEGRDAFASFVPVGLFFLLHSLRLAGFRARLYNLSHVPSRRLARRMRAIPADAVLISAFFGAHHQAFTLARLAKRFHPRAPVVLGGPLAVLAEAVLRRVPTVDFVLQGEGEESAVALLDAVLRQRGEVAAVSGLYRRSGRGVLGRPAVPLADIDRYFFLPSEVLPHCRHVRPENLAVLITSRGCPFRCAFCSSQALWPGRIRRHRPELLVRYLRDLHQTTGAIYCSIRDENFLADRRHLRAFCRLMREAGLPFLWNCQGSVRFLDEELAVELAAAGCDQ
ncbi:MAG TPA: B12-binding domain-containing radical SAM protein, partial [Desulfobacterales bacterium]|nr:B12-binding domain-containing radical SAM protein [Desulfobacterales bacterium]